MAFVFRCLVLWQYLKQTLECRPQYFEVYQRTAISTLIDKERSDIRDTCDKYSQQEQTAMIHR